MQSREIASFDLALNYGFSSGIGWFLAIVSGILFTSNNFFVKYYEIDALEMLIVRSFLQTNILALIIVLTKRKFLPEKRMDQILAVVQVYYFMLINPLY